jgi:protoheme IX farnesyltransferase
VTSQVIKEYYRLTKPGIIYGNMLTAAGGFLLACGGQFSKELAGRLIATLLGIALVIGSACVFNNYIDREIDKKMKRTQSRALAIGLIPGPAALIYATVLGIAGFSVLAVFTNTLTVLLGLLAIFSYVVLYGIAKRRTEYGTLVGSISGALPPVGGYVAVSGQLDAGALILFAIMVFWQMPHFYAIAMFRFKDYKAAGLPVLPVKRGMRTTKIHIAGYIVGFIGANLFLSIYGYTGLTYLVVMTALSLAWLRLALAGFKTADDTRWARQVFFFSLIVLLVLSVMLSVGAILP